MAKSEDNQNNPRSISATLQIFAIFSSIAICKKKLKVSKVCQCSVKAVGNSTTLSLIQQH